MEATPPKCKLMEIEGMFFTLTHRPRPLHAACMRRYRGHASFTDLLISTVCTEITRYLHLQPFPAASILSGGPDQQQALPQDGSSADISDLLKLGRETRISSRVPDPPQGSKLSVTSGAFHAGV